ncbi:hypothetical protein [Streptomyces tendae]|uniref:hypothetical protein n=1 Tax=Streptomyces tendae TaxID=1932 RepID=UPI0037947B2E
MESPAQHRAGHREGCQLAITELSVTLISENPDPPRNDLHNLDETVQSVREVGLITPIAVATVDAYLRNRSDRAGDLDDGAQYIVVDSRPSGWASAEHHLQQAVPAEGLSRAAEGPGDRGAEGGARRQPRQSVRRGAAGQG